MTTKTPEYLVVWEGDSGVIQSCVQTVCDPHQFTNHDWIVAAANAEEMDDEDIHQLMRDGWSLYLVCPMPTVFFDN